MFQKKSSVDWSWSVGVSNAIFQRFAMSTPTPLPKNSGLTVMNAEGVLRFALVGLGGWKFLHILRTRCS
jgi:hypothetical protein